MARRKRGEDVNGWLVLDKPEDFTSTDAVAAVRRLFNANKAGHAGTLDPLASGVLPIALGEATKTVPWLMEADKTYRFTVRWGVSTATQDREGEVIARSDVRPERQAIESALTGFIGEIAQVPPQYSAVKVGGERAYDLAREGQTLDLKPRQVVLHEAALVDVPDADHAVCRVRSGKGFYIRALVRDLAAALGTEGHVSQLRRTAVGPFREEDAVGLDELKELVHKAAAFERLRPVETALADIPALALTGEEAARLTNGQALSLIPFIARMPQDADPDGGLVRVMAGGKALALGRLGEGMLHPVRLLSHAV